MLKILIPVLLAYILKHLRIFKEETSKDFINYIIYFALPFLTFKSGYELGFNPQVLKLTFSIWLIILTSIFLAYMVGKLLKLNPVDFKTFLLISSFGNTAFLGFPFTYSFFGEEALKIAVLYDAFGSVLLVFSIGVFIASGRASIKTLITFPPFIGLLSGLIFSKIELPLFIIELLNFVSLSVLPVILFALGLSLSLNHISKNLTTSFLALFLKMVSGAVLAIIYTSLLKITGMPQKVIILESMMPSMVMSGVLALKFDLNSNLAFSAITLGIVLSFFIIPIFMKFILSLI
jgi:auxin efflux carrier (AEC)